MTTAAIPLLDELEISRRLASSDADALEALYHAVSPGLLLYARSLYRDSAAAEDAVQDAFVKLWERRFLLHTDRSPRSLLFRTVRNSAFNHSRDIRTRERLLAGQGDLMVWEDPGPDASLHEGELRNRLQHAVASLPPRQREALILTRLQGLSHDEVATVMGIAPRTVNNHLVRALETLREQLRDDGIPPSHQ